MSGPVYDRAQDEVDLALLADLLDGMPQRLACKKYGMSLGRVGRIWRSAYPPQPTDPEMAYEPFRPYF